MLYLRINEQGELPALEHLHPFKCLVVISEVVSPARQEEISYWLVKSGCMVMCLGRELSFVGRFC